jgi:hypothetical protein
VSLLLILVLLLVLAAALLRLRPMASFWGLLILVMPRISVGKIQLVPALVVRGNGLADAWLGLILRQQRQAANSQQPIPH